MKKIIMALLLLIGAIGFSEEEFGYKGYDLPFTSDGKLHEEVLLKRAINADDVSIEIKKLKDGKYQFWDYASDSGDENESPQITNATAPTSNNPAISNFLIFYQLLFLFFYLLY